jgi:hypothetical protein
VLGFDHDRKDVFARTAEWVEENRLECATFHSAKSSWPQAVDGRQVDAVGHGRWPHDEYALSTYIVRKASR